MTTNIQNTSTDNPLASMFRKKKMSLFLPSKGRWYPENSLILDIDGSLPVYSMNSSDDIKFRTGDISMSGRTTYSIIKSCIPGILQPESIPNIDIDSILLAIRLASYGDNFSMAVAVPNTTIAKTIDVSLKLLLSNLIQSNPNWDDEISIEDDSGNILTLVIEPISLQNIFSTSKTLYQQRQTLIKNAEADPDIKDEKLFADGLDQLTDTAVQLICASISKLTLVDSNKTVLLEIKSDSPQGAAQLLQVIKQLDIEYFNAIRDHLDAQRKKFSLYIPLQTSTEAELQAGAPLEWNTDITFVGSNFLPAAKGSSL